MEEIEKQNFLINRNLNHRRMVRVFCNVVIKAQEVAFFDAHCVLQGVYGSFVSLGQIHATGGTCADIVNHILTHSK